MLVAVLTANGIQYRNTAHNRAFFGHMQKPLQIAIDGPIGSGKSTVAREVARVLGIMLVDAGGLYRTAAYITLRDGLSSDRTSEIAKRFRTSTVEERSPNAQEQDGRNITVLLDGQDISQEIRTHQIDDLVAKIAQHKETIAAVHEKERALAQAHSVVIEGREIGTMVLPDAQVKVYLTADIHTRAKRRLEEYRRKGDETPESEIVRALKERDELDMRRAYAPLRKADDAVVIDTTDRTVQEVVEQILKLVPEEHRMLKSPAGSALG